ncbi:hypothetical protein [Yeosuana marina]|uniref:hypothetical protein n=1 Tax=Yeosuana marina TaxID=1565536 RepID=UPI001421D3FA|nr:hypothetical protein [Yeosuana marina]
MKKLLLLTAFLIAASVQSQSLTEIYSQYIQPRSSADELREGFKKVEALCAVTPQEKCNKAKASALYLLCDDYYAAAYQVYQVDPELAKPILTKAKTLFTQANGYMSIDDFTEEQKNMMLDSKLHFESDPQLKDL